MVFNMFMSWVSAIMTYLVGFCNEFLIGSK